MLLRYRHSYRDMTSSSRVAELLLAALFHGATDDPLRIRLTFERPAAGTEGYVARLAVPAETLALLDGTTSENGLLAVHVVRRDGRGISPLRRVEVPISFPKPPGPDRVFVYEIRFAAPIGKTTIVIAVEDLIGRKTAVLLREVG